MKNTKSVKQWKIITQQLKSFESPNIVDMKSVIIEHPKLYINYSRLYARLKMFPKQTLIALYMVVKKSEKFLSKKNVKITKRAHAFKGYTSSYNVGTSDSFDPEL